MKINIYQFVAVCSLIAIMQSCKVTKDYKRPELDLPQSFSEIPQTNGLIHQVPGYAEFFKDRNLIVLLDSVLSKNPDVLIASENLLSAQASLRSVKLNYLPEVNMQVNSGIQRFSKNSMTGSFAGNLLFEDYTIGPSVSWEVDLWGKLKRQREEGMANYFAQEEVKRGVIVQLIAQTAQGYYNLLNLDQQLEIAKNVENVMKETLSILQTQYEVGDVQSIAVKQAEAQLAQTRALIPEIEASIIAQENTLRLLTGNYPGKIERTSLSDKVLFDDNLSIGVPADLLANRPDVRQTELQLHAANARLGIAKTNFYPALSITGQGGLNSVKFDSWFSAPASLFGNAAAGITAPIFNKGRIKANYQVALHDREAAVHAFRKSVLIAVEEVSTIVIGIEKIKKQGVELDNQQQAISTAIEDAGVLYQNGEANYLEVLSVQQLYLQSELNNAAIRYKEINAYISLYKSLGGF